MIESLHHYLEKIVLGGLDLEKDFVGIDITERDLERFMNIVKEANLEMLPQYSMNPKVKVFKYHGVVLKFKLSKKTSDFLK